MGAAMTDFGDGSKLDPEEPNFVGKSREAHWPWKDLVPIFLMALTGPVLLPVMMLIKPDYEMVLFQNPIGLKMLGFAIVQQLVGMAAHISWTLFGSPKAPRWLSALIAILVVVFFYLGFMFTIVVGPAAIAIYQRMPRQ